MLLVFSYLIVPAVCVINLVNGVRARLLLGWIIATIVGFVLFYYAVRRFGAGLASMVSYLVPIFALTQAVVILGERPTPLEIAGGAIILLGVRLATWRAIRATPLEDAASA